MINKKESDLTDGFLKQSLAKVREAGFKPIAVTVIVLEDTFCFETEAEAIEAHRVLEKEPEPSIVQGWWYGKDEFLKTIEEQEKRWSEPEEEHIVFWLDK